MESTVRKDKSQLFFLISTIIGCSIITYLFSIYFKIDIIYTHLFYIPITIAAFWNRRWALLVAGLLGAEHIIGEYYLYQEFGTTPFLRAAIFIFTAFLIGTLLDKKEILLSKGGTSPLSDLEGNKELFELFFTNVPTATAVSSMDDGRYEFINHGFTELCGYSKEEVIGKTSKELNIFADYNDRIVVFKEVKEKGFSENKEINIIKKDGEEVTMLISCKVINMQGTEYLLTAARDITTRKNMEMAIQLSEEKYRVLFENSPEMIFVIRNGVIEICNTICEYITGYSKEELLLLPSFFDLIYTDDFEGLKKKYKFKDIGEIFQDEDAFRIVKKDGSLRWVEMKASKIMWNNAEATINFVTDITNRKITEEENTMVVQTTTDAFFLNDLEGRFLGVNDALCKMMGFTKEEILQMSVADLAYNRNGEANVKKRIEKIKEKGSSIFEAQYKRKNGDIIYAEVSVTYLPISNRMCNFLRDITERKQKEREIEFLSYHDILTGLNNRNFFEKECIRLNETGELPISVIMGDLNGLKLTNDAFGHKHGDRILCTVAEIMKVCTRGRGTIARIGGDEFCILLPNTKEEAAVIICDEIYSTCNNTELTINNSVYHPSISLGVATKIEIEKPIDETIKNAEDSMNKRKLLESKSTHNSLIANIRTTMFEKSHETREHADRLVTLAKKIGTYLNLPYNQLSDLELLGALHDIGKIGVDARILCKTSSLTEEEWVEMKKHTEIGYRIALASAELVSAAEGILCHHERWDGKGYPQGLSGENIPILARIISVVDSFDAMTHERVYRSAMSLKDAKKEIAENSGKQFDPVVVQAFLKIVNQQDI
ncbi:MAG: PAS domain S-box protein [Solirubrobacterales bacterium]